MQQLPIVLIAALMVVGSHEASLQSEERKNDEGLLDKLDVVFKPIKCIVYMIGDTFNSSIETLEVLVIACQKHSALEGYASDLLLIKSSIQVIVDFVNEVTSGKIPHRQIIQFAKSLVLMSINVPKFLTLHQAQLWLLLDISQGEEIAEIVTMLLKTMKDLAHVFLELGASTRNCFIGT